MNEDLEALAGNVHTMNIGITTVLASLIATHPNYDQFQLHLVSTLEIATNGQMGPLTDLQREQLRSYVESLQQIAAVRRKIDPTASVLSQRRGDDTPKV